MIKFKNDIINTTNFIDFDSLEVGETFIWCDECSDRKYLGMKIESIDNEYAILDLSDEIGKYYDDVYDYKILQLIDLEFTQIVK